MDLDFLVAGAFVCSVDFDTLDFGSSRLSQVIEPSAFAYLPLPILCATTTHSASS